MTVSLLLFQLYYLLILVSVFMSKNCFSCSYFFNLLFIYQLVSTLMCALIKSTEVVFIILFIINSFYFVHIF